VTSIIDTATAFKALHVPGTPFVIPNPWDAGTARMLAGIGFEALATTSAGFAFTQGLRDGHVTRDQALEHAGKIAAAVDVPVSADLENGFADAPDAAAETYRLAAATGIVGASIEDSTGNPEQPIYDFELAVERVQAAVAAVAPAAFDFTLTARSENFLHGRADLDDTIARLQAFEAAGADVLYAPGLPDLDAVATVCAAIGEIREQGTFSLASVMGGRDQIDRFMC
jgi:2-methylisocitrate lyase-like PEP mutase family enzyme